MIPTADLLCVTMKTEYSGAASFRATAGTSGVFTGTDTTANVKVYLFASLKNSLLRYLADNLSDTHSHDKEFL
jgi:hypothetical protein